MKLISKLLKSFPGLHGFTKRKYHQLRRGKILISCYFYDITREIKYSGWLRDNDTDLMKISSEMIFYYHKLEKGMCLPPPRRFFGYYAFTCVMDLVKEWETKGYSRDFPVYIATIETLRSYKAIAEGYKSTSDEAAKVCAVLSEVLANKAENNAFSTPIPQRSSDVDLSAMKSLALSRRSVRHYSEKEVADHELSNAVEIAMLSPSACNRQPCRVHFFKDKDMIKELLMFQNGNRGFSDNIPVLAIITSDQKAFFDSTERIEPIFDGGLFTMSLLYGLTSQGISSCCLNWCVDPKTDKKCRGKLNISPTEKILTFIAVGYSATDAVVPLSGRRPINEVYTIN